jgi:hypothetical protein
MRSIRLIVPLIFFASACGLDLEDCDSKADVMEGAWIVKEVYIDDERQDANNYKAYRLQLKPAGEFTRTQPAGFPDSGTWTLTDNQGVLVIAPAISPEENYVIESFDLRELVLVLNRNSSKAGPSKIRYILIPAE